MRRYAIIWVFIIMAGLYGWWIANTSDTIVSQADKLLTPAPTHALAPTKQEITHSIFVPYWNLPSQSSSVDSVYTNLLYFGISADSQGIIKNDPGYTHLASMQTVNRPRLLVLRMLTNEENSKILANSQIQRTIIVETVALAKQYQFQGVVLDLEMSAIPFTSLVSQITSFNEQLAKQCKQEKLSYGITMYGDTFYRPRPYDVKQLATFVDKVYIMAYDLHKADGQPGANFPIQDVSNEYDLQKMVVDFSNVVPADKTVVVSGLFGYDWAIDAQGIAMGSGQAISFSDLQTKFLNKCPYTICEITKDPNAGATQIHYRDGQQDHIVWFDDPDSVTQKEKFLEERGISQFSYWAYGYF